MTSLAELEAALRASWDRETLAVYGDALQAAGDPRGELIALELHAERHGAGPGHGEARRRALQAWLGPDPTETARWAAAASVHGFLGVWIVSGDPAGLPGRLSADYLDELLESPVSRYLRWVRISQDAADMQRTLRLLAARPLPWLERLGIDQGGLAGPAPPPLARIVGEAMPQLRALEVRGERAVTTPLPASVRRLQVDGRTAVVVARDGMPGVTEVDLAFQVPGRAALVALASLVGPRSMPDLARLDLSRNEPTYPASLPSNVDPLGFVQAIEAPDRLRALTLPSLRTTDQRDAVLALLAQQPALAIDVARGYEAFAAAVAGVAHPRLRLPVRWPWPPADQLSSRAALTVRLPGAPDGHDLALSRCAELLE
ncbi:MAG TPA: hypothetical protein VGC42_03960, partial [Kofleriaceae bacterium]